MNEYQVMSMREMFWETVKDVLHERYDVQKIKKVCFIGDGAPWIRESKMFVSFENTKNKFYSINFTLNKP